MNQYEAMFLFDPTFAAEFANAEGEIRRILERAGAELLFCKQWDDRRLAFKVKGRKRGVYVLTYFKAEAPKIAGLERDANLSENVLRVLVLRAEGVTPELMERAMEARTYQPPDMMDSTGAEGGAPSGPPMRRGRPAEAVGAEER